MSRGNGDGRYIDPRVGALAGEGAQQNVRTSEERLEQLARDAWQFVPSEPAPEAQRANETYYDRPAIKEPVWKWYVPAYFVAGGAAGASAVLGALACAFGGEDMRGLVKRCRWVSAAGTTIGTGFLIADLGKPERFLNMVRVFRPTSPMSVGSFILAPATGAAAASALLANAPGVLGAIGDLSGAGAGALGVPLAGYTAVLVSNSAIPAWSAVGTTLPALFTASAVNAAASLLELTDLNEEEQRVVARYALAGRLAELGAGIAVEKQASRVERVGRPFHEGFSGSLWKAGKACTTAGVLLTLASRKRTSIRRWAAVFGLAGSVCVKFAVWRAGFASARDPRATFEQQRNS